MVRRQDEVQRDLALGMPGIVKRNIQTAEHEATPLIEVNSRRIYILCLDPEAARVERLRTPSKLFHKAHADPSTTRGMIDVEMRDGGTTIPGDVLQRRNADDDSSVLGNNCRTVCGQVVPGNGIELPKRRHDDSLDKRESVTQRLDIVHDVRAESGVELRELCEI